MLPIDKVEVEPRFVVAALIGRSRPKTSWRMEKAPWSRTFQCRSDAGGFGKPHTSAQLTGIDPGHHNGWGQEALAKRSQRKASSMVLILFLLLPATRSTCSASITARIVRMSFFPKPRFLDRKCFLAAERMSTKEGT